MSNLRFWWLNQRPIKAWKGLGFSRTCFGRVLEPKRACFRVVCEDTGGGEEDDKERGA